MLLNGIYCRYNCKKGPYKGSDAINTHIYDAILLQKLHKNMANKTCQITKQSLILKDSAWKIMKARADHQCCLIVEIVLTITYKFIRYWLISTFIVQPMTQIPSLKNNGFYSCEFTLLSSFQWSTSQYCRAQLFMIIREVSSTLQLKHSVSNLATNDLVKYYRTLD
ncbi:hypothetical protein KAFR_0A02350 [Kazachstania africana CBS 2517]|uniref:Uncharacterized protein n=1 Tax=Kazachstania africana (strain ATCC 22294 / BCRC 22015 / CBS 2517 / CECT 1963 / NBRC 1671 / NRRL Y-8276) TaxID=1071382 RepID=H2AMS3_KAZAF|nr:hypothetical protein KAFR_0A02350 [Kazachstania africana CBS 2517]CCF55673.1 hypothetical protein KAFR_0A02350 [Kazachstania africana CBS 2517]